MKISPKTKISALIKANPAAIEAIASINSQFRKLRNPILRKVLASRVTIADAARIGRTSEAVFFEILLPLGFEAEGSNVAPVSPEQKAAPAPPADLPLNLVPMDVREALATGDDPFNEIMDTLDELEPNQGLLLINTFEPTPLITILKKRGYSAFVEQLSPELVNTISYKSAENPAENAEAATVNFPGAGKPSFEEVLEKFQDNLQEVDVRNMEMPLPMITILEILPRLKTYEALLVHHQRVPKILLPQLTDRGFRYIIQEQSPEKLQILIYKT